MKTFGTTITLIAILLLSLQFNLKAQNKISPVLLERIETTKKSTNKQNILILLKDRVDFYALTTQFKNDNATAHERALTTIKALKDKQANTQGTIIQYLEDIQAHNPNKVQNIKQFWITNAITATVTNDIIYDLDKFPEIDILDLDERRFIAPKVFKSENPVNKSVNGVEPGVKAINAPKMWALGYTGKNRIACGYDTGVNFRHPAIANRFLGKFLPLPEVYHSMYDFQYPVDISPSSHGTHTLGTVLGLDQQNNDTIGVAYNAYWMATDPIVSNEADIREFHVYMEVFEWILNPDGDDATVHDIPDAVNNSWGIGPDHPYYECDPVSSYILDAVDAAGIANVFSAGNEGPDAETIGMPANTARSEVNVFSVGAVNGNSNAFTIAGFSSRGPTPCYDGDNTSIKIKPEVVAPGENVRSSQGQNEYGMLSGTSMAAPHVTGAVLLLKEAFPQLPGSEILFALYNSAKDLGEPGEDNTYGKGIIDVFAAYEYLAETNTPVPPTSNNYDIAIESVDYPNFSYTAEDAVAPKITVVNYGENAVDIIYVSYSINDEESLSYEWTGTLNNQVSSTTITLPEINTINGKNNLKINIQLAIDVEEADHLNNNALLSFNKLTQVEFPYIETFEGYSNANLEENWAIINDDYAITWRIDSTGGIEGSDVSASMKFYQTGVRDHLIDELVSPIIPTGDDEELYLKFSYAYSTRLAHLYKDSLKVYLSIDKGETFPNLLFKKGGQDLATHDGDISYTDFVPEIADDWAEETIDISEFLSSENIVLKFVGVNDNGNDVYIDNIKVFSTTEPTLIAEKEIVDVIVYPNPAKNDITISNLNSFENIDKVHIYNMLGKEIFKTELSKPTISINLEHFEKGIYFIKIEIANNSITKKIFVQ